MLPRGPKWLPKRGAVGTTESGLQGPQDTTLVRPPPVPESAKARRLRNRAERTGWVHGLPKSAGDALRLASKWQEDIEVQGMSRADIARRERLTRARVTQIMALLDLSEDLQAMLLGGDEKVEDWSIRRALSEVG